MVQTMAQMKIKPSSLGIDATRSLGLQSLQALNTSLLTGIRFILNK